MTANNTPRRDPKSVNVGVVGATGLVGEIFLKLIEERHFPYGELRLFASDRSIGQKRLVQGKEQTVQGLKPECFKGLDVVFFSSGDDISKEWAPQAAAVGAIAIDNSAAFRMDAETPLVVPEINMLEAKPLGLRGGIIANPNCSTIQLVMALKPLQDKFGLKAVRVATYQAVSGAGKAAQEELLKQSAAYMQGEREFVPQNFAHPIVFNCIPQVGSFSEDGFCSEERKIRLETRKILGLPQLPITAWTVRVPTLNAHSEAAWVTLEEEASRAELISALKGMPGVQLIEGGPTDYPLAMKAADKDPVYVGRLHQDPDDPKTWLFWVVADNLRKGAALNGIQIAEALLPLWN